MAQHIRVGPLLGHFSRSFRTPLGIHNDLGNLLINIIYVFSNLSSSFLHFKDRTARLHERGSSFRLESREYSPSSITVPYYSNNFIFTIIQNGLLSALSYTWPCGSFRWCSAQRPMLWGGTISSVVRRKVFTSISLLLPACGLVGAISYTACDRVATLVIVGPSF